jgi:hypothetical protein
MTASLDPSTLAAHAPMLGAQEKTFAKTAKALAIILIV